MTKGFESLQQVAASLVGALVFTVLLIGTAVTAAPIA
jgi:multisubunit Na+/H+ antiporter MnhC subunit